MPDSAIKFYENRFVNLWRFADEQLAKTQYLAGDEITAADLAVYPISEGHEARTPGREPIRSPQARRWINRDRSALPIAGAGGVTLHFSPSLIDWN